MVGDGSTIGFEKIAALKPDLILALYAGLTEDDYKTLSQIAPTVAQPGGYVDYGIPWQELTRTVGRIVGRAARTDDLDIVSGERDQLFEVVLVDGELPALDDSEGG